MKKIILFATIFLSAASSYAQVCEVKLIDQHRRTLSVFRSHEGCKESMKQCRLEIRRRLEIDEVNPYDCLVTDTNTSSDDYQRPAPPRETRPRVEVNYQKEMKAGEIAILNDNYVTILGKSYDGLYSVRSRDGWNKITSGISRSRLSATSGCSSDICIDETVINIHRSLEFNVVGLSYYGDYVIRSRDGWNSLHSNIKRSHLARTSGCSHSYYGSLCIGNRVLNTKDNRYYTVVGIQINDKVAIRSLDGWNRISTNIDPRDLIK